MFVIIYISVCYLYVLDVCYNIYISVCYLFVLDVCYNIY